VLRLIRRPPYPGELRHELVWSATFLGGGAAAFLWFATGWSLPDCLLMKWTGLPCLGCGGTRSARCLVAFDPWQALLYHPGFTLTVLGLCLWTLYSAYVLVSRDPLRLRIAMDESGRSWLRRGLVAALLVHWVWQAFYLTRA
jgi:hypothetical protein